MIAYEKVMQEIEKTKKRFMSVKDKIPQLEERLVELAKKYTDALLDNAPDEKLNEISGEIQRVEKDVDLLEHIDIEKEIRENLSRDGKLKNMAEKFIGQQLAVIEEMLVEDDKLFNNYKAACDALLDAIKASREHTKKMAAVCGEIEAVKRALGQKIPDGGILWSYRGRRGNFNIENLYTKIRGAAGLPLIP